MKQLLASIAIGLVALAPVVSAIDRWDVNATGDDSSGTDNELRHGVSQEHDLQAVGGVADQDWYLIGQKPYSSYEVVVDGLGESVATVPPSTADDVIGLNLVNSSGGVLASSLGVSGIGADRRLIIRNTTAVEEMSEYVRVRAAVSGCGTTCTSEAFYRITMRDTTMFAPRFNNSGTQITVLILQNAHDAAVSYTARFYNTSGVLLASSSGGISARGSVAVNTSLIAALIGTSGAITVDHTAPYSMLTGKAVALEPSTGFSFDTILVPRLH